MVLSNYWQASTGIRSDFGNVRVSLKFPRVDGYMQVILACKQHRTLQNKISPRIKYSECVDGGVREKNAQIFNGKGNQDQKYDTIYVIILTHPVLQKFFSSSSSFCGAGGIPPNALQPTDAYCTNPALAYPFISRGAPRTPRERPQ
jgi:hypothetical protein